MSERDRLIMEHLYLVNATVKRLVPKVPRQIEVDDLTASGALGLCRAAARFDPGRGVKFSSYAISHIRGAILEWLRQDDWATRGMRQRERQGEAIPVKVSVETLAADSECQGLLIDPSPGPEERAMRESEQQEALGLLESLSPLYREVIAGYYLEGLTFAAIAFRLDRSETAMHRRRDVALAKLREAANG